MDTLVGIWGHAGCGNKINLLDTISFLPLAFRCWALYMYYMREARLVADIERPWYGGKEADGGKSPDDTTGI
jgi:hypothetical protein